jgi:hypothetical protein
MAAGKSYTQSKGVAGWKPPREAEVHIIKTHAFNTVFMPAFVIATIRHLFDAVASELKLGIVIAVKGVYRAHGAEHPKTIEMLDWLASRAYEWIRIADVVMRYEDIVEDKVWHVAWLAETLYPDAEIDVEAIAAELEVIPGRITRARQLPYMMGPGHVTGVGVGGWKEHLPDDLLAVMLDRYGNWFKVHGYEIGI